MSADCPETVATSPRARSRLTNDEFALPDLDRRSATGRRYRDLCIEFSDYVGGALSAAELAIVKQAAAVVVHCELTAGRMVAGHVDVDEDALVRRVNLCQRLIGLLREKRNRRTSGRRKGRRPRQHEGGQKLSDYLAGKREAAS